jgi:hypothetical protein
VSEATPLRGVAESNGAPGLAVILAVGVFSVDDALDDEHVLASIEDNAPTTNA